MNGLEYRPSWLLTFCACIGGFTHAPNAKADVFEIGSQGQWQQIDTGAADLAGLVSDEQAEQHSGLPAVMLVAVKTAGQQPVIEQISLAGLKPASGRYAPLINAAANQYGISPALVDAVMWQESRYNPKSVSSAGAIGLMQLMPGTARYLGVNPHDPWQNVFGGAAYLRQQLDRFGNNVPLALAAYNAGPGAVAKYGGVPPYAETRGYVRTITHRLMNQGQ